MSATGTTSNEQPLADQSLRTRSVLEVLGISVLVAIPCFWHEFLVCADLGSHTYTTWIATLIAAGKTPALYITTQKTNILFDWLLSATCAYFGYSAGEKLAAALAVLIFFWGAFAFLTSVGGRKRWDMVLPLAMFSYGWTFQTGLFNFYLSVGFAFAALAVLWTKTSRAYVVVLFLLSMTWLAHPLGLAVFAGVAVMELLARRYSWLGVTAGFVAAVAFTVAVRFYLVSHAYVKYSDRPFWITTGADQLMLYSVLYYWIMMGVLALWLALIVEAVLGWRSSRTEPGSKMMSVAAFYLLVKLALWILPDDVLWNTSTAEASLLVNRTTLISAVLLLAFLSQLRTRLWRTAAWALLGIVFFGALFGSTGELSHLQRIAYDKVRLLPAGARLTASGIWTTPSSVLTAHLGERACVQHCFVVSNYEIASNQFRVRARYSNPVVETNLLDNTHMDRGTYVVRAQDLPLYSLFACHNSGVCLGPLKEGDRNGAPAVELVPVNPSSHP